MSGKVVMPHAVQTDERNAPARPGLSDTRDLGAKQRQKRSLLFDTAHVNTDMLDGQRSHVRLHS